jgi:hypothetical protein
VNIRTEANTNSKILTRASVGDKFIAEEKLVTNPADGSQWYRIVRLDGNLPLENDRRFGVAVAYINANFVLIAKPEDTATKSTIRASELPREKEVTISEEGMDYTFTWILSVSDRFGYAIYLDPNFEIRESKGLDRIAFKNEGSKTTYDTFYVRIYEVNPNKPIPKNIVARGVEISYQRKHFQAENRALEIEFSHPPIEDCGAATLLRRLEIMVSTIQSIR